MPRLLNLEVRCDCGKSLLLPDRVVREPYDNESKRTWMEEIQDEATPLIVSEGWAIRTNQAGGRYAVCPACAAVPELPPLPEYESRMKCPACGHNRIGTRFCDGRARTCRGGVRDHLHRTCQRCGYDVIQATKQEKTNDRTDGDHPSPVAIGAD